MVDTTMSSTALQADRRSKQSEFKKTEIGLLPAEWDTPSLGDIVSSAQLGGNYPNTMKETEAPLIKMGNIGRGQISLAKLEYIPANATPQKRDRLRRGNILFNTRNTLELVGKVSIWNDELPEAYFNSNILRLSFHHDKVSSQRFMNSALNSGRVISALREIATGTTSVAAIYSRDLFSIKIPLPPKVEQRRIAEVLSNVDELIECLENLIAKKRLIKQGVMQDLLSGHKRLPGFGEEWCVKQLGEVGCCLRGVSYQPDRDLSTHDMAHTNRLLRSNNVQEGVINTSELQFVCELKVAAAQILSVNDILICMANGSKLLVGKAGRFMIDDGYRYTFGAFMGCFRTNNAVADPGFVFSLFQTKEYREYLSILLAGSSINNLTPKSIESLEFAFPSRPEQEAIAAVHWDMEVELTNLQVKLDKICKIKQGLMQDLLTGRVRLV